MSSVTWPFDSQGPICYRHYIVDTDDDDDTSVTDTHDINMSENTTDLCQEQQQDTTLAGVWALAAKGKGGYYVKNGLLYHTGTVAGQRCEQLCIPVTRWLQVLT